jgi:hypothetical protein
VHVARPLSGTAQGVQLVPQVSGRLLPTQTPLQSWYPLMHSHVCVVRLQREFVPHWSSSAQPISHRLVPRSQYEPVGQPSGGQVSGGASHSPAVQISSSAHALPQAPQSVRLVSTFTQTASHSMWPELHPHSWLEGSHASFVPQCSSSAQPGSQRSVERSQ